MVYSVRKSLEPRAQAPIHLPLLPSRAASQLFIKSLENPIDNIIETRFSKYNNLIKKSKIFREMYDAAAYIAGGKYVFNLLSAVGSGWEWWKG